MKRFVVFFIVVFLTFPTIALLADGSAFAEKQYEIQLVPCGKQVTVRLTGYSPNAAIYKNESANHIRCGENFFRFETLSTNKPIGVADSTGTLITTETYFSYGTFNIVYYDYYGNSFPLTYSTTGPNTVIPTVPTVQPPQPPITVYCPGLPASRLAVGMTVESTISPFLAMMMLPPGHGENIRLRRFPPGTRFSIRKGPLCLEGNIWWQADYRFPTHDQFGNVDGESQTLSWFAEFANTAHTASWVVGTPIVPVQLPTLSESRAELVSSMKDNFPSKGLYLLAREEPNVSSRVIGRIQVRDGAFPIIGTNVNGTWLQFLLRDGRPAWVCTHLTENNAAKFTIHVTSASREPCFKRS